MASSRKRARLLPTSTAAAGREVNVGRMRATDDALAGARRCAGGSMRTVFVASKSPSLPSSDPSTALACMQLPPHTLDASVTPPERSGLPRVGVRGSDRREGHFLALGSSPIEALR